MYKFIENQSLFEDLETPKAGALGVLFENKKSNVIRLLQAYLFQIKNGHFDEETSFQIHKTANLRFFCGFKNRMKLSWSLL